MYVAGPSEPNSPPVRTPTPRPTFDSPQLITHDGARTHLWGDDEAGYVLDRIIVSSDALHVLEFELAAGQSFGHSEQNRTVFAADEVLLVLAGTMLIADPTSGEAHRIDAGEAVAFGRDTWHHAHALGAEPLRVLEFFAPPPSAGAASDYARTKPLPAETVGVNRSLAGRWPGQRNAIEDDHRFTPIRRHDSAWAVAARGLASELLFSTPQLSVARHHVQLGAGTAPVAATAEVLIRCLSGDVAVHLPDARDQNLFRLTADDSLWLPAATRHRFIPTGDMPPVVVTGVPA